jgi:hypothetical protein
VFSFMKGAMSAIGAMGHSQWVFVEFSNRYHLIIVSMMREVILGYLAGTAWVVTP